MFNPASLWKAPEVNPINKKAYSLPLLNPFNLYGRVLFFSWFGFMIAFWSWYAFPPLLSDVIAKDIHLTQVQIANSNIVSLVATLLVRLVAGTACDRFGPRWTFAGCLLIGAVPTFCAGGVTNASGLMAIRFFVGILGGSFVPCQVWTTGFFDKSIVGTANSLTGGFGNSGGGITYFVMPAIYNSLVRNNGLSSHVAWRVSFVVPGILITATAIALILATPDCPTGKWSDREAAANANIRSSSIDGNIVNVPGEINGNGHRSDSENMGEKDLKADPEAAQGGQVVEEARGEVIQKPTAKEILKVCLSLQTLMLAAFYFCTFGAELAINSILGNYYEKNFPKLGLQGAGNYAAMFGLLNIVFRPLGGIVSDVVYRNTGHSVWAKKIIIHIYGVIMAAFLIALGATNPHSLSTMVGLIVGLAFFLEGCNGMVYSLVPHVHPYANGIVSGTTGASGNLGGIIFAIIFRYNGKNYGRVCWIIGVITIGLHLAVSWIKPIPRGQRGGH